MKTERRTVLVSADKVSDMLLSEFMATMARTAIEHPTLAIGFDGESGAIVGDMIA